jgi:predicted pyridoxine 5'-phosphate oxidase superfamily flavin-nucleotide-binding protein
VPTKNDVTGKAHAVEFNGDTFAVPPAEEWDIDVLEAIDENKLTHALKALLGEDQYATFRVTNKKVKDLGAFFEVAGKSVSAGNS